jgi:hypothetical protein
MFKRYQNFLDVVTILNEMGFQRKQLGATSG